MNPRFPILSGISIVLRVLGWLVALVGAAGIIVGVFELATNANVPQMQMPFMQSWWTAWIVLIALSVVALVSGLIAAAFGEIIGVLFAIEINTRCDPARPPA